MKNRLKTIAFCSPLMNRDDDLKNTLAHNISVLSKFKNRAVLHINIFNDNTNLRGWVINNFSKYIDHGLIKLNKVSPLSYWHFSLAKNSFRNFIKEDYYSSLDGDNFLSEKNVGKLFDLIDYHEKVLFHGFSGKWGDGTSGQLTLPADIYIKYGYLNDIYPRQYDEIGLIAQALFNEPDLVYASYKNVDITKKSNYFKKATEYKSISNPRIYIENEDYSAPLNPRGNDYVKESKILSYYISFNSAYTFLKSITTSESHKFHRGELFKAIKLIDNDIIEDVLKRTFTFDKTTKLSSELTVYAVIKNDFIFLNSWLAHYRELGVKRFIIIDDHSKEPIENYIFGEDIFIFKPLVGDFKNCKVYWIELLLKAYQSEGSWAVTVDSDELINLTSSFNNLDDYTYELEKNGLKHSSSILIDMLPNIDVDLSTFNGDDYIKHFNNAYIRPFGYDEDYYNHHSIRWGFGKYSEYSFRLDARWRFFSTLDSLRKIPLFKYTKSISLNQGFHTISDKNKFVKADDLFKCSKLILPIRHYKFVSFFLDKSNNTNEYHDRTKNNLNRIKKTDKISFKREIDVCPFVSDFTIEKFSEIFFKPIGLYRIIGNDISGLHSDDQTYNNLEFILQHESDFDGVDKIFVLNRISNEVKLAKFIDLLKCYQAKFLVIDFCASEYAKINFNQSSKPINYNIKTEWDKICFEISKREEKNKYAINNNGARNFSLEHGKNRYEWVLPWDGNCFVNEDIINSLKISMRDAKAKYLIIPMQRLTENNITDLKSLPTNAIEEPQIAFRYDSKEIFNENYFYGYQPKVELLKRLGVPGMWDNWNNIYPWRKSITIKSKESHSFIFSSAVYRLASGNHNTTTMTRNRSHSRSYGIIEYLDGLNNKSLNISSSEKSMNIGNANE